MDNPIMEKIESLMKYVPFIDFILKIDKEKYIKFINIRQWIISKKKYSLSALDKIEKSITTQYKNLLLQNDVKIPEEIANIFAPMKLKQFVNLCSDEEEDDKEPQNASKTNDNTKTKKTNKEPEKVDNESDDDLEIISVDYVEKPTKPKDETRANNRNKSQLARKPNADLSKKDNELDEVSQNILNKIDELGKDDLKQKNEIHEPINYTYQEKDYQDDLEDYNHDKQTNLKLEHQENNIFQRRTTCTLETNRLFKRRKDFQNNQKLEQQCIQDREDEVEVQSLDNNKSKKSKHFSQKPIETISLDSSSDTEDDNQPCTSKQAALRLAKKSSIKETTYKKQKTNNKPNYDKQIPELGDSMEALFNDIDDVLNEVHENNKNIAATKRPHQSNNQITPLEGCNDIPVEDLRENDITINNLSQEDLPKLNVEMEVLSSALKFIKQQNNENSSPISSSNHTKPAETPPPAPPPINSNLITTCTQNVTSQLPTKSIYTYNSSNICYPSQPPTVQHLPQQHLTSQYPHNHGKNWSIPTPKLNPNDPRIRKQLEQIKNYPVMNILNPGMAASIMQAQQYQQAPQHPSVKPPGYANKPLNSNTNLTSPNTTTTYSTVNISYGEHKRREEVKRLEEERLREERKSELERQRLLEEERKRKIISEREKQKLQEEMRSKLLSTLKPCEDLLASKWPKTKNNLNNNAAENNENEQIYTKAIQKKTNNEIAKDTNEKAKVTNDIPKDSSNDEAAVIQKKKSKPRPKSKQKTNDINTQNKENNKNKLEQKLNRVYNELKCTFIGFDQLHDYIPIETINNNNASESNNHKESNIPPAKPIGLKRRSSIHALTAISEQLKQTEYSDIEMSKKSNNSITSSTKTSERQRRLTDISYETISSQEMRCSSPKRRRKTIDDIIKPTKRANKLRILDDDNDDDENSSNIIMSDNERTFNNLRENSKVKNPIIKLQRLRNSAIRKHTNKPSNETSDDFSNKLKKKCEKPASVDMFINTKKSKKTKRNNDCQMTEHNTLFCVLCNSKPSDLTNHYIGRHKTESYVSRLDWSELDDLTVNIPIAKLLPKTKNCRNDRYEVKCPFCKDSIQNTFMNLYHHYSSHTGEYAFQCGQCNLTKPYHADIHSHILHSKICRNSNIKILYRYSANAQCIYLHYCVICNFVQINKANVMKHLREHHEHTQDVPSNVGKCILVAISDAPEVNESFKPPTPSPTPSPVQHETVLSNEETLVNTNITAEINTKENDIRQNIMVETQVSQTLDFKIDDDDIPVGNEPCLDDDDEYSVEAQIKQLHEEPSTSRNTVTAKNIIQTPMTIIHCMVNEQSRILQPTPHKPLPIKSEFMDIEEKCILTPQRQTTTTTTANDSNQNLANTLSTPLFITYDKYRNYPSNVNYFGLYKCMMDDCYYSTDIGEEFCQHLNEHYASQENLQPIQPLQCSYCIIPPEMVMDPRQLVEHVRTQHSHMIYQCSLCCYRSYNASNVKIHQQIHHDPSVENCKIYKCSEISEQNSIGVLALKPSLEELLEKNIKNICCKICSTEYYHTKFLINHLKNVHDVYDVADIEIYSCLYCPLTLAIKDELHHHLATKHPDKQPRVYDHSIQNNNSNEDIKNILNVVELSETVDCIEHTSTINNINVEHLDEQSQDALDIKPSLQQLMEMNEETVKVRLRKLTKHTGIPPDNLYRCPEAKCGGFFSNYSLWLRHMKNRHQCIECQCPHCNLVESLQQLELHFEQHLRHTFICFHCPATFACDVKAREHAANTHRDLGEMRTEHIRFNISYCYYIMLKIDLYIERQIFVAELLKLIDERLKELESNESKTFKQLWPVHDTALWMDNYLARLQNRKVLRSCLITNCGFQTVNSDILFEHLRSTHVIDKTTFSCSICDNQIKDCENLDVIIKHLKIHNSSLCICTACVSQSTSNRSKMSLHIEQHHTARDVPVVRIFKNNHKLFFEIYIVFADNCLTFSTIKNCFCCPEKNMNPERFASHLKRYHKFTLIYFCEKCKSNSQFQSLDEVKTHFRQEHPTEKLKIRCKLSAQHDLRLISLNDLQVEILKQQQSLTSLVEIKNEPLEATEDDDDVILLEENDIVIENAIKEAKQQEAKEIPKIKCAPLGALIHPTISNVDNNTNMTLTNTSTNYQQPSRSSTILHNTSLHLQQSTATMISPHIYSSRNNTNIPVSVIHSNNLNTHPTKNRVIINQLPPSHILNSTSPTNSKHATNNNINNYYSRNMSNSYLSNPTDAVNNSHKTILTNNRILITENVNGALVSQPQHSINLPTYNISMSSHHNYVTTVNNFR